jgi:acyl-CoA reductase-like NAD-dependent aldehyde dehydrogenase
MTDTPDLASLFPPSGGVPADVWRTPDEAGLTLLVDGEARRWGGPREEIRSAVCARAGDGVLERLALGPGAQASGELALEAARAAARAWAGGRGEWPRASAGERIACVLDFVRRARPLREAVARALMWEVGKPWPDCLKEFDRTIEYIEATAEALREVERAAAAPVAAGGFVARVRRAPLGVALCLGPYNYAVNEVFTTVVPALVMGNPVVMKTPRYGVLANALLVPALRDSFPKGVVNLVTGTGPVVVGPIMESGVVDVLALIGSARTASVLLKQHPHPYRLRTMLGMGAKNPAIVLRDADLDAAAAEIVSGALNFNGQRCTALKHVLVDRSVADALVDRLAARVSLLRVGMPWEERVAITPLPDPEKPKHLAALVDDATARGAKVVNRGGGEWAGTLYRPALVYPVPEEAQLFRVEPFGPVLPVSVVGSPEEALGIVERSEFGQQASVFGRDPAAIGPIVDHLANLVCRVNVNTQCRRGPDVFPFAGRKDSAVGTLSITDALRVFSIRSLVAAEERERALLDALGQRSVFLGPPPA